MVALEHLEVHAQRSPGALCLSLGVRNRLPRWQQVLATVQGCPWRVGRATVARWCMAQTRSGAFRSRSSAGFTVRSYSAARFHLTRPPWLLAMPAASGGYPWWEG